MTTALPASGLAPTFAQAVALIIAGLCRTTASRIVVDRAAGPLLVRIFTRLHRLAARLTSLAARIQAGPLPPPQPARPAAGAERRPRRRPRLPEGAGWLIRLVPETAVYAGQVQTLLDDPQTAALLKVAPQAGRILRPLCRMLALPLPGHLRRTRGGSVPSPAGAQSVDPPRPPPPTAALAWSPPSPVACLTPRVSTFAAGLPPHPD